MTAAQQFHPHYTVDDYQGWEGDWELWNGMAVSMSPSPFGKHQMVLVNLVAELRTALRAIDCNATVLCEIDWIISRDTVVRPDALVVCGSVPEGHVETIPKLVAEIFSPSTAERDRTHKRDLYYNAGGGDLFDSRPTEKHCGNLPSNRRGTPGNRSLQHLYIETLPRLQNPTRSTQFLHALRRSAKEDFPALTRRASEDRATELLACASGWSILIYRTPKSSRYGN